MNENWRWSLAVLTQRRWLEAGDAVAVAAGGGGRAATTGAGRAAARAGGREGSSVRRRQGGAACRGSVYGRNFLGGNKKNFNIITHISAKTKKK